MRCLGDMDQHWMQGHHAPNFTNLPERFSQVFLMSVAVASGNATITIFH